MDEHRIFKVPEDQCHIGLFWATAGNSSQSKIEGRPVYDKVLKCEILAPNQTKSTPVVELLRIFPDGTEKHNATYYDKYRSQVELFRGSDKGGDLQGTPLDQWPMMDMQTTATFKAMKLYTVEQVRDMGDTVKQHFGLGAREWQDKARNWLAAAADGAVVGRLTTELAQRDARIADLEGQIAELAQRMTAQEERRGPGRPRKEEAA